MNERNKYTDASAVLRDLGHIEKRKQHQMAAEGRRHEARWKAIIDNATRSREQLLARQMPEVVALVEQFEDES